jgi:hypothetical protein
MAILRIRDKNGNITEVTAIKGEKGEKGDKGEDYIITEADKQEIAERVINTLPKWTGGSY